MEDGLRDQLENLIRPEVELAGFELFELEVLRGGGRLTLRVSIDAADPGVGSASVEDCAAVSRAVGRMLDAEPEERLGRYVIEVSSPGLFRPLRTPRHYRRFLGEIVKLVVARADGSTQQVRGPLREVTDESIRIGDGDEAQTLRFQEIRKAHLDPDLEFGKTDKRSSRRQ